MDQLSIALHQSKLKYSWPPSIAEFVALLKPSFSDYNLAEPREAFYEACRCRMDPREFHWSHPAVYHAARQTGFYLLKTSPEKMIWPIFNKNYEAICERVFAGENLNVPKTIAIENKSDVTLIENISNTAEKLGIDTGLLYFMQKPNGSRIRNTLRQQALKQIEELGIQLKEDLPV